MQIPVRKDSLPMAGALLVAAVAGGTVAIVGATLVGVGENTTTVREVVREPTLLQSEVSRSETRRSLTLRDIYAQNAPAVVQVTRTTTVQLPRTQWFGNPFGMPGTEVQTSLGSGFVIDKAGFIVTNYHVVADARSVYVSFSNNESMKAEIVGKDASTDVALLKVEASSRALKPLSLGDSDRVQVGDQVAAIGNPLGLDRSITLGIVSGLHRSLASPGGAPIDRVIQTDAMLNHGNSGGPLLNAQGQVVGVSSAVANEGSGSTGIGFAIPINTVRSVVAQLKTRGFAEHPFLGIVTTPVTPRVARVFNFPAEEGLLVESVLPGSGAEGAGLVAGSNEVVLEGESYPLGGDLIVKVDGMDVTSTERLREIVSRHKPGESVSIEFFRGTERRTVEVKLGRQSPPPLE